LMAKSPNGMVRSSGMGSGRNMPLFSSGYWARKAAYFSNPAPSASGEGALMLTSRPVLRS
jgi:hypothetical protein